MIDSPMGTNRSAEEQVVAAPDGAQVGGAHGRRSGLGNAWRSTVTRSVARRPVRVGGVAVAAEHLVQVGRQGAGAPRR